MKSISCFHNIMLYDCPAGFEEGAGEAIWPWRFVPWHVVDCVLDFLFYERFIKCCHVVLLDAQEVPDEVYMSGWWAPHGL